MAFDPVLPEVHESRETQKCKHQYSYCAMKSQRGWLLHESPTLLGSTVPTTSSTMSLTVQLARRPHCKPVNQCKQRVARESSSLVLSFLSLLSSIDCWASLACGVLLLIRFLRMSSRFRRYSYQQSARHHVGVQRRPSSGEELLNVSSQVVCSEPSSSPRSAMASSLSHQSNIPFLIHLSHIVTYTPYLPTWVYNSPDLLAPISDLMLNEFREEYYVICSGNAHNNYASLYTTLSRNGKKAKRNKDVHLPSSSLPPSCHNL